MSTDQQRWASVFEYQRVWGILAPLLLVPLLLLGCRQGEDEAADPAPAPEQSEAAPEAPSQTDPTPPSEAAADDPETLLWQALAAGGHIAVLRHGQADPPRGGRDADEGERQGALNEYGAAQAEELGERWRAHGVAKPRVVASPYQRTSETARLLALGDVSAEDALAPLGEGGMPRDQALSISRTLIAEHRGPETLLLVTHQPNVFALTGEVVSPADMVVLRRDGEGLQVLGVIAAPRP